jgi:vancomycin resistance protein YoaR
VLLLIVALLWLAVLVLVIAVAVYEVRQSGVIHQGVWVSFVDLSGLTPEQAKAALEAAGIVLPVEPMAVRYDEQQWLIHPEDLHVSLDVEASVERAFQVGRSGPLLDELREQLHAYREGRYLNPLFTLHDGGHLAYTVALIAQEINQPTREAALEVHGTEVSSRPGMDGREVDQATTVAALEERIRSGGGGEVGLIVRQTQPALADLSEGAELIRSVIGSPLVLQHEDEHHGALEYTIDRETLAAWMDWDMQIQTEGDSHPQFSVSVDGASVQAWAQALAAELALTPQDATFHFDPETRVLSATTPSKWGRELDAQTTAQRILAQATTDERVVDLPVMLIRPGRPMEDAPNMGIVDLVAQGTTVFKGSSEARVHNIAQAASRFKGVLIDPGAVFSFNEHLGEVSEETGYEESLIIFGDETQVGIGGGVCQVSTTAFRAALLGGYPIRERYAHGYVVSWYGEPGMDATVFAPHVDLKFLNDSDYYLYIDTVTDTEEGTLTFNFYGTPSGREVEIIVAAPENVTDPPPPLYTLDPELPTGTIKQVDWAVRGMDVTVERIVREGDEIVFEDAFVSKYEPWNAKYLYGPDTPLPAGAIPEPTETEG